MRIVKNRIWRVAVIIAVAFLVSIDAATGQEISVSPAASWYRDARFGMFIHWGPYSLRGFEASWPLFQGLIPMGEYEALPSQFNPVKFDAEKIVKLALETGMKYIIFTTKHHDGFAMFDTKLSAYSIMNTPYGKDIVKQLVDACHRNGMKIGFYFSLCDWYHPQYRDKTKPFPAGCKPEEVNQATWDQYLEFMKGQLRELCSNYGKIDIIWFDGGWERTAEQWKSAEIDSMIRLLQPEILINNRHLLDDKADFLTPEQFIPTATQMKLWETCMTINSTWAYNPYDHDYKSSRQLIHTLVRAVSGGGNFLLNVGPMPEGEIQRDFEERLGRIGEWLRKNGESIYGTRHGPARLYPGGFATVKGQRLFVHLPDGHDGLLLLHGIKNKIASIAVQGFSQSIAFKQEGLRTVIRIPYEAMDPYNTVVALELDGNLDYDPFVYAQDGGRFILLSSRAEILGSGMSYTLKRILVSYSSEEDALVGWSQTDDMVRWKCAITQSGEYSIVMNYDGGPALLNLSIQNQDVVITAPKTNRLERYRGMPRGTVNLKAGETEVRLHLKSIESSSRFKLRQIQLVPKN